MQCSLKQIMHLSDCTDVQDDELVGHTSDSMFSLIATQMYLQHKKGGTYVRSRQ